MEPTADFLGGPRVWHLFNGFGRDMIKKLIFAAQNQAVEFHYQTRVKRISRENGKGAVTGAIVQVKDGAEVLTYMKKPIYCGSVDLNFLKRHKDYKKMKALYEQGFKAIVENGTYINILEKYFGTEPDSVFAEGVQETDSRKNITEEKKDVF